MLYIFKIVTECEREGERESKCEEDMKTETNNNTKSKIERGRKGGREQTKQEIFLK